MKYIPRDFKYIMYIYTYVKHIYIYIYIFFFFVYLKEKLSKEKGINMKTLRDFSVPQAEGDKTIGEAGTQWLAQIEVTFGNLEAADEGVQLKD